MDPDQELAKERHRNLTIWKEAMALVNDVYTTTKTFPKDEVWGLTSQIRRAGVSIASNIAEGSKRPDDDFRRFLSYSLGSLAELDTQLMIAEMQGYAPYAHEMKSRIEGRLRLRTRPFEKDQMHFCSEAQMLSCRGRSRPSGVDLPTRHPLMGGETYYQAAV